MSAAFSPSFDRLDNNNFGKAPSAFPAFTDALAVNSTLRELTLSNNHFNDAPSFKKLALSCRVPTVVLANNRTLGVCPSGVAGICCAQSSLWGCVARGGVFAFHAQLPGA